MAMEVIAWLIALPLLGAVTGLRTFTAMAVLCWYARLGYLPVPGDWPFWTAKLSVTLLFTILAAGELVADKQPWMPDRIRFGSVLAKLALGGLIGAIVANSLNGAEIEGIILAALGVLVGTYGGFLVRREIVRKGTWKDWQVATAEDAVAIFCAILAMGVVTA